MNKISLTLAVVLIAAVHVARGDVLELKSGSVLNGKYGGGTATSVKFESTAGAQEIPTAQISALTFTTAATAPAAPLTPTAQPKSTVTLPAGTTLMVRMMDSVSSKDKAGANFTAKLETDLTGGGVVAVRSGTMVYGKVQSSTQARRAVGQSTLDLRLTQIVVDGQSVPIMTSGYQESGQRSGAKAAKGAAAGAAIGAIGGNAGKGAAIGATTGALVKGETVTVPPGTLLEFTLAQPLTIAAAQ